jgi:hypothetical protein
MDIVDAPFHVIRYGVVTQMAQHSGPCLPEYLSFPQYKSGFLCPVLEFAQALPKPLSAGPTFDPKVPFPGLPAIVRKSQKGKLLRFLASPVRILPSKPPEYLGSDLFIATVVQHGMSTFDFPSGSLPFLQVLFDHRWISPEHNVNKKSTKMTYATHPLQRKE